MSDQLDLFARPAAPDPSAALAPGVVLFRGLALPVAATLLDEIAAVAAASPFRHMLTPNGQRMSAALTSAGPLGWVSDRAGYRYSLTDPEHGRPWPAMPPSFRDLAARAADAADFAAFDPDACLLNRYAPGAKMSLHQDKDERDFSQPIVSVSLGLPTTFLLGGPTRADRVTPIPLAHGDVLVFGGPARLLFHGVRPIPEGHHPTVGPFRINLTFRKAG